MRCQTDRDKKTAYTLAAHSGVSFLTLSSLIFDKCSCSPAADLEVEENERSWRKDMCRNHFLLLRNKKKNATIRWMKRGISINIDLSL